MHGLKAKTLKNMLKKAGFKTSGKKATLRARAKSAHLIRGGGGMEQYAPATGGRRSLKAKTLKKLLKKAGMKVSGKKATLRARAKSAHLIRGGTASSGSLDQALPLGSA
jgi:ElaB/YqjD/DUF883 family membrane-anchored ribosome-binding protein